MVYIVKAMFLTFSGLQVYDRLKIIFWDVTRELLTLFFASSPLSVIAQVGISLCIKIQFILKLNNQCFLFITRTAHEQYFATGSVPYYSPMEKTVLCIVPTYVVHLLFIHLAIEYWNLLTYNYF